jgi:hypothetical protein
MPGRGSGRSIGLAGCSLTAVDAEKTGDGSRGLEELVKAVGSPELEPTDQALAVALYRASAEGMPVTEAVLARRCGLGGGSGHRHAWALACVA